MSTELFDCAAQKLEALTDLDRLEARGTLRIALKEAGLEAKNLSINQLAAVFEKLMPQQLELRAVDDAGSICSAVIKEVRLSGSSTDALTTPSSDEIFGRLGSR